MPTLNTMSKVKNRRFQYSCLLIDGLSLHIPDMVYAYNGFLRRCYTLVAFFSSHTNNTSPLTSSANLISSLPLSWITILCTYDKAIAWAYYPPLTVWVHSSYNTITPHISSSISVKYNSLQASNTNTVAQNSLLFLVLLTKYKSYLSKTRINPLAPDFFF